MSKFNLEIVKIDKPFAIEDMPMGNKIYVIDDYLETSTHRWMKNSITQGPRWSKSNQVNARHPTGLPHHSLWGASFFKTDGNGAPMMER
jgi:hypothetical protein